MMMEYRYRIQIICCIYILYSTSSYALNLNYEVGAGVDYSNNITRVSINEISGTTRRMNLMVDLNHQSETLNFQFIPRISYYNYTPEELENQTLYTLDSSLLWEIVKSTLAWSIDNYTDQTPIDITQPATSFNQQTTNVFYTGPDMKLRVGGGKSIALLLRYADFYYEVDDTVDNERYGGLLQFLNQTSPRSTFSFNLLRGDTRYKNDIINENYTRDDIFIGLNHLARNYNINFDAGYTVIKRDISEELDGFLAHFNGVLNLSSKSNITILGRSEYTDSSRAFLESRFLSEELRQFNTAISSDILYDKSILAAYNWNDSITIINFQLGTTDQDYEEDSLDSLDQKIKYAEVTFSRHAGRLAEVYINARWSNTNYKITSIEDDDELYRVGMNYRLSRSIYINLDYEHAVRNSTSISRNYTADTIFARINLRR